MEEVLLESCTSRSSERRLAAAASDGTVAVWSLQTGAPPGSLPLHTFAEHAAACTGLQWSPVNQHLLASCALDAALVFYDASKKLVVRVLHLARALTAMAFAPNGLLCTCGTDGGELHVVDLRQESGASRRHRCRRSWPLPRGAHVLSGSHSVVEQAHPYGLCRRTMARCARLPSSAPPLAAVVRWARPPPLATPLATSPPLPRSQCRGCSMPRLRCWPPMARQ